MGHLRMMAATQPFISGAISKTVNMPEDATVEDIMKPICRAWKLGLKAIAIYRDGSKRTQPPRPGRRRAQASATSPRQATRAGFELTGAQARPGAACRTTAARSTHKFIQVAGHEGYITVGLYADGTPGELFIKMAKEGSTVSGLMDTLGY